MFARMALTLAFIGLTGTLLIAAQDLSRAAGWIPRVVLSVTLVFVVLQGFLDWRTATRPGTIAETARWRRSREWSAACWIGGLLAAAWALGVVVGAALFSCAWLRWHAGERWWFCGLFGCVLGGGLWLVFDVLLGADLYSGLW